MTIDTALIEREWFGVAPDGSECKVLLRVGRPIRDTHGAWKVDASLEGLEAGVEAVVGVDSWQAVSEGMHHLMIRISHLEGKGWRFFWERGGETATAMDLTRGA